ncbi:NUDIX hydrolase [Nonomuraea sp. NPDC050310]|uniref:NUDIX hydrolase n=1 Tax=unclassified Nonomuraea TaxID=2593643 RepID=UPI0033D63888
MTNDFWSTIHRVLAGAAAYITDPQGRVLLVDPNYRDHWIFPGGSLDAGEEPAQACAREITEELGLELPVGDLLAVQWVPAYDTRPYPLVSFVFDCGVIPADTPIKVQEAELDGYGFFDPEEAAGLLAPSLHQRLLAAREARADGRIRYLPPTTVS